MAKRKRDPDQLTVKVLANGDEETLWFDDVGALRDKGVCIGHHPGNDFLVVTIMDDDATNHFAFIRRAMLKKLLPYLTRFADGADFFTEDTCLTPSI